MAQRTRGNANSPQRKLEILTRAFYVGAYRAAEEFKVGKDSIYRWKAEDPEAWARIAEREGPRLEKIAVAQSQEALVQIGNVELMLAERLEREFEDLSAKELSDFAAAQQKLATAKGINGTKLLELTGRPTHVIADRSGAEILRQLRSQVPGLVVESTAVEEPLKEIAPPD